jgi:hypothetical protein
MRGKIASGLGQAQYFLTRAAYSRQFVQKLGFATFPGTLNVRLEGLFPAELPAIRIEGFSEEGRSFGECKCYRIKLNGIEAAVVRPERSRRRPARPPGGKEAASSNGGGKRLALSRHGRAGCDRDRSGKRRGGSGGHPGRADADGWQADLAPVFFIGNTVQSIYRIVRKRVRRERKV